jgi:hypothetical protein
LICFSGIALQAQSISERDVDSSGNITIITTRDTLASDPNYCYTEGFIYNSDSVNYYGLVFYFDAHQIFFLTAKDKIRFILVGFYYNYFTIIFNYITLLLFIFKLYLFRLITNNNLI